MNYLTTCLTKHFNMLFMTIFLIITAVQNSHAGLKIVIPKKTNQTDKITQQKNTITSVHKNLKSGKYSCVELVNRYLAKIKKYDLALNRGAPLNAYVAVNPSVLQQAQALDNYFAQNTQFIGPLHCIPVIIKDNIDSIDTPSTSGSLALLGSQPNKDAVIVKQLKSAGAIIMGKGTMDEFASGVIGISSRSGRVGNAYDPTQNPGGSSSGPAVAVSTDLAMIGIGTDNNGSVRIPAVFNGIYGLRPSSDSLSKVGIFPRGNLDGVPGPLARNMKDLATVYSVIQKPETKQAKHSVYGSLDPLKFLNKNSLRGKRIGLVKSAAGHTTFNKNNIPINQIFQQAVDQFKDNQATIIPIALPEFNPDRTNNTAGEISEINNYLNSFASTRKSFLDICNSDRTLTFGDKKECLEYAENNPAPTSKIYKDTVKMFEKNRAYIQKVMETQHLDALLIPISKAGSASYNIRQLNTLAAISSNTGLPSVTIIAGYTDTDNTEVAMPVGMELVGSMHAESEIINMAYAFEKSSPARQIPNLGKPDNTALKNFTIAQLNNLFTQLGYASYVQILKDGSADDLTADKFSAIVAKRVAVSQHKTKGQD